MQVNGTRYDSLDEMEKAVLKAQSDLIAASPFLSHQELEREIGKCKRLQLAFTRALVFFVNSEERY